MFASWVRPIHRNPTVWGNGEFLKQQVPRTCYVEDRLERLAHAHLAGRPQPGAGGNRGRRISRLSIGQRRGLDALGLPNASGAGAMPFLPRAWSPWPHQRNLASTFLLRRKEENNWSTSSESGALF